MPNVAKKHPAARTVDRRRRRARPWSAALRLPITARPRTMTSAPAMRRGGNGSFNTKRASMHAAERRAGRLDDAAVAERNKQVTDISQKRERQSAEQRERDCRAAIPSRRDRGKPSAATNGSSASPGQTKRCSAMTSGDRPTSMPWRAATKPSAQHKAAPVPHNRPSAAERGEGRDPFRRASSGDQARAAMVADGHRVSLRARSAPASSRRTGRCPRTNSPDSMFCRNGSAAM